MFFPLLVIIRVPPIIDTDNLLRFTKLVKCIPEFLFFYCVLKKINIISEIKRSKLQTRHLYMHWTTLDLRRIFENQINYTARHTSLLKFGNYDPGAELQGPA